MTGIACPASLDGRHHARPRMSLVWLGGEPHEQGCCTNCRAEVVREARTPTLWMTR